MSIYCMLALMVASIYLCAGVAHLIERRTIEGSRDIILSTLYTCIALIK